MRTLFVPLALMASVVTGRAQFTDATLPPLSTTDGASIQTSPENTQWASSALSNYSTTGSFVTPAAGGTDAWGHTWTTTAPEFTSINQNGGTIREIFLGPGDTSWMPAVGYTYLTSPYSSGNSYTLAYLSDDTFSPSALGFGDVADVNFPAGWEQNFDFWIDTKSGVYTLLNPANSQTSADASAQVLWTSSPLLIPTWVPALGDFENVETWIGSLVETPVNGQSHEFRFAVQAFEAQGTPFGGSTPVPEASTYGAVGALGLGLLVLKRARRR